MEAQSGLLRTQPTPLQRVFPVIDRRLVVPGGRSGRAMPKLGCVTGQIHLLSHVRRRQPPNRIPRTGGVLRIDAYLRTQPLEYLVETTTRIRRPKPRQPHPITAIIYLHLGAFVQAYRRRPNAKRTILIHLDTSKQYLKSRVTARCPAIMTHSRLS